MNKLNTYSNLIWSALFFVFLTSFIISDQESVNGDKHRTKWEWLFDGKSTNAWVSADGQPFLGNGWEIQNKQLIVWGNTPEHHAGHDIITKQQYDNFELELEVKLTEGANSGIKYFVANTFANYEGQYLGLEYQLIDDERHPDAKLGVNGNRTIASLYDLIPASKNKKIYPPGKWNKVRILVDGDHVEHWINGGKVLEYDRKSDHFKKIVALSKYKNMENFGEIDKGHILLQGHNDEVAFKSIRIRTW